MSFLAPGYLTASCIAAAGAVLLHFIVTRRPRSIRFPTARFVPDVPVVARSRSLHLSDLLLLALRVITILLVGAALARPVFPPQRERVVRVIAADVSNSVASVAEVRDSVRALFRSGDALVVFDTSARSAGGPDSVLARPRVTGPGSLSAALVVALRAGSGVRDGADSVELVIVSPATTAERDRATSTIRALWPGRGRVVPVAAANAQSLQSSYDPVFLGSGRPRFAVARNRIDTVGAVEARGNVVVAQFERRWRYTTDSLARSRVIARWDDGQPAAIESDNGTSCARSIAIPVDSAGDATLRPSFVLFRAILAAPCGTAASPPDAGIARMLAGRASLARADLFPSPQDIDSPLARWLAVIAVVLAVSELVVRRARDAGRQS
ncbi:MAG: BatA domain-containing protein [Gemmatimonadaceae bacterium]